MIVILLRILLFTDAFRIVDYEYNFYVIVLVSLPSFLSLLVGLSQVILLTESAVLFQNVQLRQR